MADRSALRPLAQRPFIQHYVFDLEAPARWEGPVIRLADLTDEERIRIGGRAAADQLPSRVLTWRCRNPYCRHWASPRASAPDRCNLCLTPRST